MTEAFVRNIEQFIAAEGIDLIAFEKGQRKDDITQKYLRKFRKIEGVLYVGKAQHIRGSSKQLRIREETLVDWTSYGLIEFAAPIGRRALENRVMKAAARPS
jgi:hypothetical protein